MNTQGKYEHHDNHGHENHGHENHGALEFFSSYKPLCSNQTYISEVLQKGLSRSEKNSAEASRLIQFSHRELLLKAKQFYQDLTLPRPVDSLLAPQSLVGEQNQVL